MFKGTAFHFFSGVLGLAILPAIAVAEMPRSVTPPDAPSIVPSSPSVHFLEFSTGVHKFDYREDLVLPLKSSESAVIPTVQAAYRFDRGPRAVLFSARVDSSVAATTLYDGSKQKYDVDGQPTEVVPASGFKSNQFIEAEGDIASPAYVFNSKVDLRSYTGLGYRYWRRGDGLLGSGDYQEDYRWFILPVGAILELRPSDRVQVNVDASARLQWNGNVDVELSSLNAPGKNELLQDTNVDLGHSVGYKLQLPIQYHAFSAASLSVTPWMEYSGLGQSAQVPVLTASGKSVGSVQEPSSRTLQYGSMIGVSLGL